MKFFIGIILIVVLSAVAEHYLPWWSIAFVAFVVSLIIGQKASRAFLMGFLGVAVFWLVAVMMQDMANDHILSRRMAALFHLPNYGLFIVITVFVGALVGGLAAWAGALLRPR